jgi:D-glycero-D-manno-heptose 1,7-bisphosphate phosphatase
MNDQMKKPAVFLDRDGTINEQMGYINHPGRFFLLPGVAEAIRLLNANGFLTFVVSNQSGVARGYFTVELVHEIHAKMEKMLAKDGARLDGIFFCPHHPGGAVPEYSVECDCRKPGVGLMEKACRRFDIDMEGSYVIGDRCLDMEMARRAGLEGILVLTGYGRGERDYLLPGSPAKPAHVAEDLLGAVHWIIDLKKNSRTSRYPA